jgi:hypothetical protein
MMLVSPLNNIDKNTMEMTKTEFERALAPK